MSAPGPQLDVSLALARLTLAIDDAIAALADQRQFTDRRRLKRVLAGARAWVDAAYLHSTDVSARLATARRLHWERDMIDGLCPFEPERRV